MISGYRVSSHREEMDFDAIHTYISSTYWAEGIPKETFKKALDNSLCFGVFSSEGKQVGFARMITDQATFAYLADVFIDEAHRGKGLSKWLMQEVHDHPSLQGLRRILLATRDAHSLYQQFGYTPLSSPSTFMQKWQPDIYKG
ncbi:MAG: GNAT family N-acetyltransferase [Gammaproteobacteria bacterium]|nr:GNAT family N-acetyltransferase [Gammaproteobacteria bacterium]MBU2022366.1 GNAT family N-acetyltransferase [Gammaproteobacteria bacterium]MBU2319095.1 GNAT family N-acetyltransferase [Gammaproteobacteria bacterium]MBU2412898.1 GNAT family N-acetyltransferase [Gammaproteobacteria bacterium]